MSDKSQFLHISFDLKGTVKHADLEKKFDLAIDWLMYAPNCWIVWTTSSPKKWYERLISVPGMDERNIFISEVNMETSYGQFLQWMWDWTKK